MGHPDCLIPELFLPKSWFPFSIKWDIVSDRTSESKDSKYLISVPLPQNNDKAAYPGTTVCLLTTLEPFVSP